MELCRKKAITNLPYKELKLNQMASIRSLVFISSFLLLWLFSHVDATASDHRWPANRIWNSVHPILKGHHGIFKHEDWKIAHATFYGAGDGSGTMGKLINADINLYIYI